MQSVKNMLEVSLRIFSLILFTSWFVWWWFIAQKNHAKERKQSLLETVSKYSNFAIVVFIFFQYFGTSVFSYTSTISVLIGAVCVAMGITISVLGRLALGRQWVPAYQAKASERLVTTGVYAYIRHPIYAGILLVYVGMELVVGSWLWVSMLFVAIPLLVQIKTEEKILAASFGKAYVDYQARTKMLIPFVL